MAALQGLRRLKEGFEKKLTNSEISRGYIFVTMDKEAKKIIGENFLLKVKDVSFKNKNIDSFGRVSIGREVAKKLAGKKIVLRLKGNLLTLE